MKKQRVIISTEYIKLGQLLKLVNLISSGSDAKDFILTNEISLNGEKVTQRGKKIYPSDILVINNSLLFEITKW